VSAAPALPMLYVSTWLNYAGATHSWEIAGRRQRCRAGRLEPAPARFRYDAEI